ncbi:MAG TPA: FCD domain-containing protein [Gammaproteobacteria bacterium]
MQTTESAETLASAVFRRMQSDILEGRMRPGAPLRVHALKDTYGVGNSPLREALSRLTSHGLVERSEHKGFRVASASTTELLEVIKTRCALEELALRESIADGDDQWEERVLLAHHRLARTQRPEVMAQIGSRTDWEARHREFHLALLSGCSSSILIGYCADLQERTFRYRNLSSVRSYRKGLATDEHCAIKDAVLAREADRAMDLLKSHYQATGAVVAESADLDR